MLLQFVFTAGTVVLGLFVASKVLGMDIGGSGQGQRRGGNDQKWGSGRCVRRTLLTCSVTCLHVDPWNFDGIFPASHPPR